jgi:hypothetical protein
MRRFICTIFAIMLLSTCVCAETKLPDGSVQGLPQNIIVMDENGYSPEENGELYIYIPNMLPGEVYTKDVTISNMRDDAVYSIFMKATPNYNGGEVDLLNETECKLYLDDKLIYQGLVNGDGTPNMQDDGIDLGGIYQSGESRKLHAEFVWNITDETQDFVDKYNDELKDYHGIVSFHWIFYGEVSGGSTTTTSRTTGGGGGGGSHKRTTTSTEIIDTPNDDTTPDDGRGTIVIPNYPTNPDSNNPDNSEGTSEFSESASGDTSDIENDIRDKTTVDKIVDKIIDKTPFIPDDVKTGYRSELEMYTKIAVAAFVVAVAIAIAIAFKVRKLRRLKKEM